MFWKRTLKGNGGDKWKIIMRIKDQNKRSEAYRTNNFSNIARKEVISGSFLRFLKI